MQDHILLGSEERIIEVSDTDWRQHLAEARVRGQERLRFMTPDHHLVRNVVVRSLPGNRGRPLTPEAIARAAGLSLERTETILGDLERHLFFLVRNAAGQVNWAFPVTVDATPHRVTFSTGEQLFAA